MSAAGKEIILIGVGSPQKVVGSILDGSENVPTQILIGRNVVEASLDVGRVDDNRLLRAVGCVEAEFIDDTLEDRVEAASADVLSGPVDLEGVVGHRVDGVGGELSFLAAFCTGDFEAMFDIGYQELCSVVCAIEKELFTDWIDAVKKELSN